MSDQKTRREVWETVQTINRLFTSGRSDGLEEYFHEDMVAITAMDRRRIEGREACVASWKAFAEAATVDYWHETDPRIHLMADGRCAVVSYYYDSRFEIGGQTVEAKGRDMVVLVHEAGRWQVVADHFSADPQGACPACDTTPSN
ncbi:MAG: nuclear transport factor 2 family protein [Pseudomonadota bacterium]